MKARESGMPAEDYWSSFFDADCIVEKMECATHGAGVVVEFGCGYGTFTLPLARRTRGTIHALDIEPELIAKLGEKAADEGLANIRPAQCDFVTNGTGLAGASADHAMLFNILHLEDPVSLLREAYRVLRPGGTASVIHWNHDASTPRGPSMEIRPRPADCRAWAEEAGFSFTRFQDLRECCEFHYGLILDRP